MIDTVVDRTALAALTPARRAALIYGAAKAELSRTLWQAALGTDSAPATPSVDGATRIANTTTPLDTLLAALFDDDGPSPAPVARHDTVPAPATATIATSSSASSTAAAAVSTTGLGANAEYAPLLSAAATRTGIPVAALAAIVDAEAGKARDGSWQVHSRNPRSSAAGLGQFLSRTWIGMAETKGTALNALATARGWIGVDGRVADQARAPLLALRYDPAASIDAIADYARTNLAGIRRAGVGDDNDVGATARLAYLGHHLGLGDAIRFLRDGGLSSGHARTLLDAQIGTTAARQRIDTAGDASAAHRTWLLGYLDRNIRPDRFAAV